MAIDLEKVFSVPQEGSVSSIGESWRMFGGLEPFANASQMVIGVAGSIGSGERVIGEQWFVGDGVGEAPGHGTFSLSGLRRCMNP